MATLAESLAMLTAHLLPSLTAKSWAFPSSLLTLKENKYFTKEVAEVQPWTRVPVLIFFPIVACRRGPSVLRSPKSPLKPLESVRVYQAPGSAVCRAG